MINQLNKKTKKKKVSITKNCFLKKNKQSIFIDIDDCNKNNKTPRTIKT